MSTPDFDALRAERNAAMAAFAEEMRADGWDVSECALRDSDACYCACGSGGPCEHTWNGPEYVSDDGCMSSATCARCGLTAFSHSMRNCP
jgi:hypothetical protein